MNPETYAVEAEVHRTHWWFAGRRRLLHRQVRELQPRHTWRILEVGAGTGANLSTLAEIGAAQVVACDLSLDALRHAYRANGVALARADACRLPFANASFDLLLAADVIEHLDDDTAALDEFVRVLKPGGHLVLTVPAFPALWGPQDVVAHHRRRYLRGSLLDLLTRAGLPVRTCFHFNYLLFAPIWVARKALLAMKVQVSSENTINTDLMNRLLTRVFFADVDAAPLLRAPFGVSLCLVATKPATR
jgi:ubiquinone/menaquinone biosynthesis C-methylase UbiE